MSNGSASLTLSSLAAGSHSITAVYGGDASYEGAISAGITQSVLIATKTTLSANKSNVNQGQNVKFTANLSPSAATGSVNIIDGPLFLDTVPLNGASATLRVNPDGGNPHHHRHLQRSGEVRLEHILGRHRHRPLVGSVNLRRASTG